MRSGSSIRRRITIAIVLGYTVAPILGMAFLVHVIGVLDGQQLRTLLTTSAIPYYAFSTLLGAVIFFRWYLAPVFALADGKGSLHEVFPRMCRFGRYYWLLFILRHVVGASVFLFVARDLGADLAGIWLRVVVLTIPVSILAGLPVFVFVIDCFASACDNHRLENPILRVRTRVFLLSVLVPVFLNVLILAFLRTQFVELSSELVLVYSVFTVFSIVTAYSLMHSLNRSVAELRKVSQRDGGALQLQSMDEFGVLTSDYRVLLEELESQANLMHLRNQVLQVYKGEEDVETVYQGLLSLVASELHLSDASFVVVGKLDQPCQIVSTIGQLPTIAKASSELVAIARSQKVSVVEVAEKGEPGRFVVVPTQANADYEQALVIVAHLSEGQELADIALETLGKLGEEIASVIRSTRTASEKSELEKMLVESQRMEMIGHLAAGVAHDFNNILTVVVAATDVLLEEVVEDGKDNSTLAPLVQRQADMIKESSQRAVALTRQLLTFSRQKVVSATVVELNAAIHGLDNFLTRVLGKGVVLKLDLLDGASRIKADAGHIDQVVTNLVLNASDAMPDGGTISVVTRRDAGWVILEVHDEGIGIDTELLAHIFDPFFTTKTREKGTGLGLATVDGIVRSCGGSINIESEVGTGTVFTLRFPEVPDSGVQGPAKPQLPTSNKGEAKVPGLSVLLAEDDDDVRRMLSMVLKRKGYQVIEAADGTEALELILSKDLHVDFLLSDILMPGLKGTEVATHMLKERPGIKILLMTGFADVAILEDAKSKGIPVMDKPFSPNELLIKMEELLS